MPLGGDGLLANWSNPSSTSSPSINNTLLFAGMFLDPVTGIAQDGARWYNSSTGTFLTRDPAQSSPNLYCYCGNDPIDQTDPSGMVVNNEASWTAPYNPCRGPAMPPCMAYRLLLTTNLSFLLPAEGPGIRRFRRGPTGHSLRLMEVIGRP